jgi:hypothetical protein
VKFTKFLVLGAGIIGLLAFFMPLTAVSRAGVTVKISAYDAVAGIDSLQDVVGDADTTGEANEQDLKEINEALGEVKMIILAMFVPALFLLLFGGLGTMKKKFGRGFGAGALIFGLIGLGIWAILNTAASEIEAETNESIKGLGMWMLMLTGLGGTVGGLLALIKPDRGPAA